MKQHHTILPVKAVIGLTALAMGMMSASANQAAITNQEPGPNLLDDIDLFDESYEADENALIANDKITKALGTIHEKAASVGLSFYIEQAFNQSWIHNPVPGTHSHQTWYLLHAHAAFNLIESSRHQGTWIKVELSGSSALNGNTRDTGSLDSAFGSSGPLHTDVFEDGLYYLPEVLISQGFCKGKGVFMFGVVNQTNYFDANSYANSSFGQFTNAAFVNSQVVPLVDGNFGVVLQGQLSDNWYAQIGSSMTDNEPDHSPFNNTRGRNFNIVGEVGWTHENVLGLGAGTYRIQPFMFHNEGDNSRGGIALNFEQDLGRESPFAIFSRTGWSQAGHGNAAGAAFQTSAGIIFKKPLETMGVMKEADSNFLGVSFALTKPDRDCLAEERDPSKREYTFECTYCFAVTRFLSIQPTFQYVHNPAGRDDTNNVSVFAIQSILYF